MKAFSDTEPDLMPAVWFDGRSSRGLPVLCGLTADPEGVGLCLHPLQAGLPLRRFSRAEIDWSADVPDGDGPLHLPLADAGTLRLVDRQRWRRACVAAGLRPALWHRIERRWSTLLGLGGLSLLVLWAVLHLSTPWMAGWLTRYVPLSWEQTLARQAMVSADQRLLHPSRLDPARQQQLRQAFQGLVAHLPASLQAYPGYRPDLVLAFRRGMGPNAFALPGGQVVMTDELVALAQREHLDDDALMGVLAHEVGHVWYRHGTRLLVEQGVLNVGLGLALGDLSTLLSSGGSLLTGLSYQRRHEEEADCFALRVMRADARPLAPMADLLERLEAATHTGPDARSDTSGAASWGDFLRTHPATAQRVQRLRTAQVDGCH